MKKLNLWLLASLFVAAFTLSACGDDDDAPKPATIVGTVWYEEANSNPDNHYFQIWDFDKNGEAYFGTLAKDKSSGEWTKRYNHTWTYQVNGNQYSAVNEFGVKISGTYTIEGDVLILSTEGKMIRVTGEILDRYKNAKLMPK